MANTNDKTSNEVSKEIRKSIKIDTKTNALLDKGNVLVKKLVAKNSKAMENTELALQKAKPEQKARYQSKLEGLKVMDGHLNSLADVFLSIQSEINDESKLLRTQARMLGKKEVVQKAVRDEELSLRKQRAMVIDVVKRINALCGKKE